MHIDYAAHHVPIIQYHFPVKNGGVFLFKELFLIGI